MRPILTVREFDTIVCNKDYKDNPCFVYLEEEKFRELEHFVKDYVTESDDSDIIEFLKIGYRRNVGDIISMNSFVGIIELPSGFQIEILPKISFDKDEGNDRTKLTFLKMLKSLSDFDGRALGSAALGTATMNLYEIFIKMYLDETDRLIKHGLKSSYVLKEDNLKFFKGKMNVSGQIRHNLTHGERFYMQYDEYQLNCPENRLVKTTLLKLQKATQSYDNSRKIRQLLEAFELVDISTNLQEDFTKVNLNRATKDYDMLIRWAMIFLMNKSFTTFSGTTSGRALLFPMEQVFEEFVAKWVKKVFEEKSDRTLDVSKQDKGYYLFEEPQKFRLRPDIVVRGQDGSTIIMDTKWKSLISNSQKNYGISQGDMYQMYVYAKKYQSPKIILLYPLNGDVNNDDNMKKLSFKAVLDGELEANVRVFFIDLDPDHIEESINELYNFAYKCDLQ